MPEIVGMMEEEGLWLVQGVFFVLLPLLLIGLFLRVNMGIWGVLFTFNGKRNSMKVSPPSSLGTVATSKRLARLKAVNSLREDPVVIKAVLLTDKREGRPR